MAIEESVRWRVIRAIIGCSTLEISRMLGANRNSVGQWEKGLHSPNSSSRKMYAELCKKHNIAIRPDGFPVPVE